MTLANKTSFLFFPHLSSILYACGRISSSPSLLRSGLRRELVGREGTASAPPHGRDLIGREGAASAPPRRISSTASRLRSSTQDLLDCDVEGGGRHRITCLGLDRSVDVEEEELRVWGPPRRAGARAGSTCSTRRTPPSPPMSSSV
jgi:hypothetical protein